MSLKRLQVGNNGRASLQASISSVALSLSLYENSGATLEDYLAGIPSGTGIAFTITVEDELILCAARTGAAVTVYEEDTHLLGFLSAGENGRGYGSTSAASHDADKQAEVRSTKQLFDSLASGIEDAETELALRYTKDEIDAILRAKNWKDSVVCATDSAKTLASDFENGDVIDGVTLATGDRVLVKDQATKKDNGIYTVNASGAPTRATDFDATAEITGAAVVVEEGTANADALFICTSDDPVVGTDDIEFAQIVSLTKATDADAAAGTDDVKYTTVDKVVHLLGNLASGIATYFANTRTAKTTSVGADSLMLCDSADSSKDKKVTVLNFLKNLRKAGVTTKSVAATSDTLSIAHGLGGIPNWVKIKVSANGKTGTTSGPAAYSDGEKTPTNESCVYVRSWYSGGYQGTAGHSTNKILTIGFLDTTTSKTITATAVLNATNIVLTFTNTHSAAHSINIKWEVGY